MVWGKKDRFIKVDLAHEIVEKLPNALLEILDKAGHYIHMDTPEKLVDVVTQFLINETQNRIISKSQEKELEQILA